MAKWDHDDLRDRSGEMRIAEYTPEYVKQQQADMKTPAKTHGTVLGTQVGGDHYTKHKIQPITYIWANGLGFSEGNVVKYVTRWKDKGGVKDLKKARHHLDLLIEEVEKNGVPS